MLIGKNPLKEQPDWFKKNIEIIPLSNTVEVDDKNIILKVISLVNSGPYCAAN